MRNSPYIKAITLSLFTVMVVTFIAYRSGVFNRFFEEPKQVRKNELPLFIPIPKVYENKPAAQLNIASNTFASRHPASEVLMSTSKSTSVIPTESMIDLMLQKQQMSTSKSALHIDPSPRGRFIPSYILERLFRNTQKDISSGQNHFYLQQGSSENRRTP